MIYQNREEKVKLCRKRRRRNMSEMLETASLYSLDPFRLNLPGYNSAIMIPRILIGKAR